MAFGHVLARVHQVVGIRDAYLQRKLSDQPAEERDRWVNESHGFSFVALSELIISVHCLGDDFDETITRLRNLDVHEPSSREFVSETADAVGGVGADVFL